MTQSFRIGEWRVCSDLGTITRGESMTRLEPKVMDVLVYLAEHNGDVLPKGTIIRAVWSDLFVTDEVLTNAISALRKAFGDDPKNPRYIETLPRRGYRLVAEVEECDAEEDPTSSRILMEPGRGGLQEPANKHRLQSILWWSAAGCAVLALGAWYWLGAPDPAVFDTPPAELRSIPLTSYPGYEYSASFSPDGESVAFDWCRNWVSDCDIYIKQVGVDPPVPLTETPEEELWPVWSPDGRKIAFLRQLSSGKMGLIVVPSRGGSEKNLGEIEDSPDNVIYNAPTSPLSWSPDSKFIAAQVQAPGTRTSALWLFSAETGERKRVTRPPRGVSFCRDSGPAFSPDGRVLAFSRKSESGERIYLLDLSFGYEPIGLPKPLPTLTDESNSPVWTPDGQYLLYRVPTFGAAGVTGDLWRVAVSGSAPAVQVLEQIDSPSLSPQGKRLAYSVKVADPNIWQLHLSASGRIVGLPSPLIETTRLDHSPAWSPDGRKIAFTSTAGGQLRIWICDADGSNASTVSIATGGSANSFPSWSPDGEHLVFQASDEERVLWVSRTDGTSPRSLSTGWREQAVMWPSWSHDGRWIYFRSMRAGSNIWKIPAGGGEAIRVTQDGGDVPQESPDGAMLYFQKSEDFPRRCSVWRMPVAGGPEARVLDNVHCYGGWAVATSGIYFVRLRGMEEQWEIRFREFQSGRTDVITTFDRLPRMRLAISPDESRLLFVRHDYAGADLMLVENFR